MFQWRVVLLALLAVLLLVGGLSSLTVPNLQEGPVVYRFDEQHAIRALDILGFVLLLMGCAVVWSAGALWQRRMYAD